MRKRLVSIVVALILAGLVGHVVWQGIVLDPQLRAKRRAINQRRAGGMSRNPVKWRAMAIARER